MFSLEFVNQRVPPAIAPSVFGELQTESVKEVLSSNQRHVPKTRNAALIGSDGKFTLKRFEQLGATSITGKMVRQSIVSRKRDARTDEQYRLSLEPSQCDFVGRTDAVNI